MWILSEKSIVQKNWFRKYEEKKDFLGESECNFLKETKNFFPQKNTQKKKMPK